MVMWHYDETPEQAAFQLTNVLFAVPQISVKWQLLNEGQREMIRAYTDLWIAYRDTLLGGEMLYKSYANNFPYVSARSEKTQIGAVYAGQNAYIEVLTDEIVIVNASLDSRVCVHCGERAEYTYRISDCRGRETGTGVIALGGELTIPVIPQVPVNGVIRLTDECAKPCCGCAETTFINQTINDLQASVNSLAGNVSSLGDRLTAFITSYVLSRKTLQ